MRVQSKDEAQRRADQIGSFNEELLILERDKILALSDEQRQTLAGYHEKLLRQLIVDYDVDANSREKQLSLGMRIASFLGALGLAASVFFLFYQFWGRFPTPVQVAILFLAPLLGLGATMLISHREKTGYFAKLLALVSLACFVLNLTMLGQIFNITPSPNAFLVWAMFAFLLAYATDARLLLAAGILSFAGFLSAQTGTWGGCYWLHFGERPENFFPAAAVLFLIPLIPHHRYSGFSEIFRVFSLLLLFLPVLVLANWGHASYLPFNPTGIETIYQVIGFIGSGCAIWLGIRMQWPEVVNTGNVFFTVFLYTKFYDWWWDWMPKYLFFLIIGLASMLMLLMFSRLRKSAITHAKEERT